MRRMKQWLSLLLVLAMVLCLLPTVTAAADGGDEPSFVKYDSEGRICSVRFPMTLTHMDLPIRASYVGYSAYGNAVKLFHIPGELDWGEYYSRSGLGFDLIEKDSGRYIDLGPESDERFEYKVYTFCLYFSANRDEEFAENLTVYGYHGVNFDISPDRIDMPADRIYRIDSSNGKVLICAKFDLDLCYYGAVEFKKTVAGTHDGSYTAAIPLAWYNRHDILSDGKLDYDPGTKTLNVRGDLDYLYQLRSIDSDALNVNVEADVNIDELVLCDASLGGSGTMTIGKLTMGSGIPSPTTTGSFSPAAPRLSKNGSGETRSCWKTRGSSLPRARLSTDSAI